MLRFYTCRICGNLIEMIEDSGVTPSCCGDDMEEMIPGATDGAKEKHVPIYAASENNDDKMCTQLITVKVGEEPHPMDAGHFIDWIEVWTNEGTYRKKLDYSHKPQTDFCLKKSEKIRAVYAHCTVHGLWINSMC